MIEPSINKLLERAENRYTLVILAAKRARQISDGAHRLTEKEASNAVSSAINEINEGKITYVRTKSGIK